VPKINSIIINFLTNYPNVGKKLSFIKKIVAEITVFEKNL